MSQQRVKECGHLLKDQGIPFTVQRRLVLEGVLSLKNHPTADQVYREVVSRIPGLSRATVYRTLETFARLGVITKLDHAGRAVRFDGRVDGHHHLICVRCDSVFDLSDQRLDDLPRPDTSAMGFEVTELRVQARGVCRACRDSRPSDESI